MRRVRPITALSVCVLVAMSAHAAERNAFYGDLHVHTHFSFDAYSFGNRNSPDVAYQYARGGAIRHPSGYVIQLDRPLDFYAVTDHGLFLGMFMAMENPAHPLHQDPEARRYLDSYTGTLVTGQGPDLSATVSYLRDHPDPGAARSAWHEIIASAERNYEPGALTTFIAYEYTSSHPDGGNQHRNVIFRGSAVPELPFSRIDSANPEDLWAWLDDMRAQGIEGLAIPHNSNQSQGRRFARQQESGEPLDAEYARLRMRNEPLLEVTQIKGTSETHPLLSPNDEWADFELLPLSTEMEHLRGSFARDAYLTGLEFEEKEGFNPYKFGLVAASDVHNSGSAFEESKYTSKLGLHDGTPEGRGSVPPNGAKTWDETQVGVRRSLPYFGASGLAAVWAEENTRESIYDAFRRKETFATTGPRIRLRFFGSYGFDDAALRDAFLIAKAYEHGVPMGADLPARGSGVPQFLVWAVQDPESAKLQRVQVIKGWVEDGRPQERVYDVACSDGLEVDAESHRCPDNGAAVNLTDCSVSAGLGATQLRTLWTDPDFDRSQRAFYYVRALENPTCRWSTWDAIRAGTPPLPDLATTLQERAFSSPIWLIPERTGE